MYLYLHEDLCKSHGYRGGKYYTRTQVGYNANGTPRYKYFYSAEDYEKWKNTQQTPAGSGEDLKRQVAREHEEGTKYVQQHVKNKAPAPLETSKGDKEEDQRSKQEMLYVKG